MPEHMHGRRWLCLTRGALLIPLLTPTGGAQPAVPGSAAPAPAAAIAEYRRLPIRPLGPITASAKDSLGPLLVARGLSDGSVIVGVFLAGRTLGYRKILHFDSTLQTHRLLRDSTHFPQLVHVPGDSTILFDAGSRSLVMLDPQLRDVRTMSLPRIRDFQGMQGFTRTPMLDPKGRLVYLGDFPPPPQKPGTGPNALPTPFLPDTAPLVRADFDTRQVDTIAVIRISQPGKVALLDGGGVVTVNWKINPLTAADEWTMLPDGSIAILRASDYHIDWIDPDGSRRSTPRMPMDWQRVTDARRQFLIDSLQPFLDTMRTRTPPRVEQTPDGPRRVAFKWEAIAPDSFPSYEPPIGPGSLRVDLDGNLWILPRTASLAPNGGGLVYDIVNRKGEIVERVQLPKGMALVNFGPGGVLYLNRVEGQTGFLHRARIR